MMITLFYCDFNIEVIPTFDLITLPVFNCIINPMDIIGVSEKFSHHLYYFLEAARLRAVLTETLAALEALRARLG